MDEVKIILEEAEIGMNKSISHLNIELSKKHNVQTRSQNC